MKCGECDRFKPESKATGEFGSCEVNHADGSVTKMHVHKDSAGCEVPLPKPTDEATQHLAAEVANMLKEKEQAARMPEHGLCEFCRNGEGKGYNLGTAICYTCEWSGAGKIDNWISKAATLPDSGTRREFGTGAVRDCGEGKGRCDLLPLDIIANVTGDAVLTFIDFFIRKGHDYNLNYAIQEFCLRNKSSNRTENYYDWLLDYSKHMEMGCQKYGDRNWEMGIPLHCYIDSGVRHYLKYRAGWKDEPHDRAFLWNMFGCLWTLKHKPEMNDLPFKESK